MKVDKEQGSQCSISASKERWSELSLGSDSVVARGCSIQLFVVLYNGRWLIDQDAGFECAFRGDGPETREDLDQQESD